jgi:hypothetical protein
MKMSIYHVSSEGFGLVVKNKMKKKQKKGKNFENQTLFFGYIPVPTQGGVT